MYIQKEGDNHLLPLRQKTEFGTLREVVLGRTDKAAFPPKCKANANFTDHIEDLGPDFYDKYEENALIPAIEAKPEVMEAYDKLQADLTKISTTSATVRLVTGPSRLPTSGRSSVMCSSRQASVTTSRSPQ
jgi:hypothetical protein